MPINLNEITVPQEVARNPESYASIKDYVDAVDNPKCSLCRQSLMPTDTIGQFYKVHTLDICLLFIINKSGIKL